MKKKILIVIYPGYEEKHTHQLHSFIHENYNDVATIELFNLPRYTIPKIAIYVNNKLRGWIQQNYIYELDLQMEYLKGSGTCCNIL